MCVCVKMTSNNDYMVHLCIFLCPISRSFSVTLDNKYEDEIMGVSVDHGFQYGVKNAERTHVYIRDLLILLEQGIVYVAEFVMRVTYPKHLGFYKHRVQNQRKGYRVGKINSSWPNQFILELTIL